MESQLLLILAITTTVLSALLIKYIFFKPAMTVDPFFARSWQLDLELTRKLNPREDYDPSKNDFEGRKIIYTIKPDGSILHYFDDTLDESKLKILASDKNTLRLSAESHNDTIYYKFERVDDQAVTLQIRFNSLDFDPQKRVYYRLVKDPNRLDLPSGIGKNVDDIPKTLHRDSAPPQ